ncbi:hypothetical protein LINGRAHAP2_LOCUS18901 [Linum grandiflorum]
MNQEGDHRRTWADLPPDISKFIISKLISGDESLHRRFKVGDQLGYPRRDLNDAGIPPDVRTQVSNSTIVCKFSDHKGWLLLHLFDLSRSRSCCFNPLLPWPSCFITLPTLYILAPERPIAAAFSASPNRSGGDLRMLVFHSGYMFRALRIRMPPGEEEEEEYVISDRTVRVPVAAEYRGGKFFVLFESGDILVWDTEEGLGTMLIANPPVNLAIRRDMNQVRAVGKSLVMIWSWECPRSFQLVKVKETQTAKNHQRGNDGRIGKLEEGIKSATYFVGENINIKIKKNNPSLVDICIRWLLFVCFISIPVCFSFIFWITNNEKSG